MRPRRVPWDLEPTPLARAVDAARRAGRPLLDLTVSNPTTVGLSMDADLVLGALADPGGMRYAPEPAGPLAARAAVAAYYAEHGARIDPDAVVLTASTSEAYAFLFKVLCDPGDTVAVPRPSYPLFEFLTTLEAASRAPYSLRYDGAWRIDLDEVRAALSAGARAVLVVQPSNPVGAVVDDTERAELVRLCARHDAALVVDEVFLDDAASARTLAGETGCTTFVLSGLSKVCALPQLKCAWVVSSGPGSSEARARLEIVCDTFLSVNTPVALALPELLAGRAGVRSAIGERLRANRDTLARLRPADAVFDVVTGEAGWYAVLRVPAVRSDEAWASALLGDDVVVHPGHLYDLGGTHLVVSCLPEPEVFERGMARVVARLGDGA